MKKKYDLLVKTGEFTNGQGQKKNRYQNVGAVIEGDNGPYILLEKTFNPAGIQDGKNTILISMFEPKEKQNNDDGELPF